MQMIRTPVSNLRWVASRCFLKPGFLKTYVKAALTTPIIAALLIPASHI